MAPIVNTVKLVTASTGLLLNVYGHAKSKCRHCGSETRLRVIRLFVMVQRKNVAVKIEDLGLWTRTFRKRGVRFITGIRGERRTGRALLGRWLEQRPL